MQRPDFWSEPQTAQALVKELQDLKAEAEGGGTYDRGGAVLGLTGGLAHLLQLANKQAPKDTPPPPRDPDA